MHSTDLRIGTKTREGLTVLRFGGRYNSTMRLIKTERSAQMILQKRKPKKEIVLWTVWAVMIVSIFLRVEWLGLLTIEPTTSHNLAVQSERYYH